MRELTKVFHGGSVVCARGGFFARKSPQVNLLVVDFDRRNPRAPSVLAYTLIAALVIVSLSGIGNILRLGARTEIGKAIIQAIPVLVVNAHLGKDSVVHVNFSAAVDAHRIVPVIAGGRLSLPTPPHQEIVVTSVYDSVLAFSEGNEFDRLIERLDNSVSFHVVLHDLTSNEIVRCSAAFSLYQGEVELCL
jgi:hypothetical protein